MSFGLKVPLSLRGTGATSGDQKGRTDLRAAALPSHSAVLSELPVSVLTNAPGPHRTGPDGALGMRGRVHKAVPCSLICGCPVSSPTLSLSGVTVGAGHSLAQLSDALQSIVSQQPSERTETCRALLNHLRTLAGVQIRSMAVRVPAGR